MAANGTCAGYTLGSMPDITGVETIPNDIDVVMIVGNNVSHPAMVNCCAPNKVQLLDGCYLWCQIPGGNFHTNTNQTTAELTTKEDIFRNISTCLDLNGLKESDRASVQAHIPSMGGRVSSTLSTMGLGVWALVMFGVLMR